MDKFGVYKMKIDDLDEVMQIEEESFSMPWSRWMFERELDESKLSYFLVAKDGNKIIGYIGFWLVIEEAHIVTIAVRKEYRRKGVGTVLLASALIIADTLGAKKATLEVRVSNIPAQNMYEMFGFETVSIRKSFYTDTNEDAYVMWLYNLNANIGRIRSLGQEAQLRLLSEEDGIRLN